jgi:hypothetical protein
MNLRKRSVSSPGGMVVMKSSKESLGIAGSDIQLPNTKRSVPSFTEQLQSSKQLTPFIYISWKERAFLNHIYAVAEVQDTLYTAPTQWEHVLAVGAINSVEEIFAL